MKKHLIIFSVAFVLISAFAILSTYAAEMADLFGLRRKYLPVTFTVQGEDLTLSWASLEYPCVYEVETLSRTTGLLKNAPEYHLLTRTKTLTPRITVPRAAIPTFYRISARGIFTEVHRGEQIMANPNYPTPPRPIPIIHYTGKNPASLMPFLIWHVVPNAVCYEVELLSAPPEIEGGIEHSERYHLESTTKVFTNGYQADLRPYLTTNNSQLTTIYWRARALGLHREPIGEFSIAEPIFVNENLPLPNCPLINNFDFISFKPQPIYPVYSWIPIHSAAKYEVELLNHPPAVENNYEASADSLWRQSTVDQSSCYDEYSRPYAGAYYWRVRALDEDNQPISAWSNSEKFIVEDYTKGIYAAILGDSISHGGGAVSYSPRSLEYSYATYIDFPVINLSRSGDTARTTLERFERDVLPFKPKNLIISTGANSLRDERISAESVMEDLSKINELCQKNNIRAVFLTLMPINPENIRYVFRTETDPRWHEKMTAVNKFIKKNFVSIDIERYFYDNFGEMDAKFSIDGLHTDLRGKMLMGELINQHRNLFRSAGK